MSLVGPQPIASTPVRRKAPDQSFSHVLSNPVLTITLHGRFCHWSRFVNEESEPRFTADEMQAMSYPLLFLITTVRIIV